MLVRLVLVVALAAAVTAPGPGNPPAPVPPAAAPGPPSPEQLAAWGRDLGHADYLTRERASAALWEAGEAARPALAAALRGRQPEASGRARDILERFDAGDYPDTPAEVRGLIEEFRSGDVARQVAAIPKFVRLGAAAAPTLRSLLTRDLVPGYRDYVFRRLQVAVAEEAPRLIVDRRFADAEALLALNTLGPVDEGVLDYVVFLKLRGRLKQPLPDLDYRATQQGPTGEAARRARVYLARAAGDLPRAKTLALELEKADPKAGALVDALLEDTGDWAALAARPVAAANSAEGLKAFRLRLAGETDKADTLLDAEQKSPDVDTGLAGAVDAPALALLMNGRSLAGLERIKKAGNSPHILSAALTMRLQLPAALELLQVPAAKPDPTDPRLPDIRLEPLRGGHRGLLLARLGRRGEADKQFGEVGAAVATAAGATTINALEQLVRAEVRAGRFDLACEHAARGLAAREAAQYRGRTGQDSFELLFDADADAAQYLWQQLRARDPATRAAPAAGMALIRRALKGQADAEETERLLKAAGAERLSARTPQAQTQAVALAALHAAAGRRPEAIRELARVADAALREPPDAGPAAEDPARPAVLASRSWIFGTDESFRFWLGLGDLLVEENRPADAADYLWRAWQRSPGNPLLLDACARAHRLAGDKDKAERYREAAHWVALGNARLRGRYLDELLNRGHATDARRERELVADVAWAPNALGGNVWNQVARGALLDRDFAAAARAHRRSIHAMLARPNQYYVDGTAYLTIPQLVRGHDARALLEAGKPEEAVAIARDYAALVPAAPSPLLGLIPDLDAKGRRADGDALFQTVWDQYQPLLRDHPDSAWALSGAATFAAGCRRELDAALKYAKRACELEPDVPGHLETLAEVHFRRGEREPALAVMRRLAAGDRHSHFYKRQLVRYATGDPAGRETDVTD